MAGNATEQFIIYMFKNKLTSGKIYHVFNRGVEKRPIFIDDHDHLRFIRGLLIFNDIKPILNFNHKFEAVYKSDKDKDREPLVDILGFCLMPNHFHLLLRQKEDDGIRKFMTKIGIGYANYFNLKYERVGGLYQGNFKSVLIDDESQFLYIPYYIHLNPLGLIFPDWKEKGINKPKRALEFLNSYRWSSHPDYAGWSNFSSVLEMNPLNEIFNGAENYKKDLYEFIKDVDFSDIKDVLIEETEKRGFPFPNRFSKPYIWGITLWISWGILGILKVFENLDSLTLIWQ